MKTACFFLLAAGIACAGAIEEWDRFEKQVRDQTIPKERAKSIFPALYQSLKVLCRNDTLATPSPWVFPVQGYGMSDMGKGGFRPGSYYGGSAIKGYDFFDGNKHGGHPAYDIFIRDRDLDGRNDRTGKRVNVVAPRDVLIMSVTTNWEASSPVRGGKYVWALAPEGDLLLYFAHLDTVTVAAGRVVRAGETIGAVGRSGKNAAIKKSPTHLHMMALKVENGRIEAVDFARFLEK